MGGPEAEGAPLEAKECSGEVWGRMWCGLHLTNSVEVTKLLTASVACLLGGKHIIHPSL